MNGERLSPVRSSERLSSVDTLRGLAVLCILVMNIYAFAMPMAAYFNPLVYGGDSGVDLHTWSATHLLFDQKFMTIFSMLFGAGLVLMGTRATRFAGVYYRRLLWLAVIGIAHGYLLWWGDILYFYAIGGLLLYPLRRLSARKLLIIGIALVLVGLPMSSGMGYFFAYMKAAAAEADAKMLAGKTPTELQLGMYEGWQDARQGMAPTPEDIAEEVGRYLGGYWDIVVSRAPDLLFSQIFGTIFFVPWRIAGLMVIGMALMKLGVFAAQRSSRFYIICIALGYGIGLPLVAFSALTLFAHDFHFLYSFKVGGHFNYVGSVIVAVGHIGMVMLICRTGALPWLRARLAEVGRMAFTNYLLQSLICTTLFYGYGFALFGRVGRFAQMGVVLLVWLLLIVLSRYWLRRFRFGPAEWLWRSLTYCRRQPMRLL